MTGRRKPFELGFSSLGEPSATLSGLGSIAQTFALDFLELRALEGTTDLPAHFTPERAAAARASLAVPVRLIASNLHLIGAGAPEIYTFSEFAAVADALGAPYVRVFGGGDWRQPRTNAELKQAAETVARCRDALRNRGIHAEMLLETHFGFSSTIECLRLNEILSEPISILWDSEHTWHRHGESPAQSWSRVGPWVCHVHYKDTRAGSQGLQGDGELMLPGMGDYPVNELVHTLECAGYSGGVSLEWEKLWHPELPPLSEALGLFLAQFGRAPRRPRSEATRL